MRLREITSRVRRQAPAPVVRALRRLVLAWGWLTAPWRATPGIILVGAQRSGTTTLFRMFEEHPQLVRPTQDKGIGYFDDLYGKGPRWYQAHFPLRLPRLRSRDRDVVAFECSGYYLFHPLAAERMARDLPGVQVVVLVRDPVERALSAYRHESARGFEDLPLTEALACEEERLAGEVERLRTEPGYRSFHHRHHGYLARGRYGEQVRRLVEELGPERVHVVDADALFARPQEEYRRLQEALGLPVHVPAQVEQWNARPGGDRLAPGQRAALLAHFEESDAELARYLGGPPTWRSEAVTDAR